MRILQIAPLWEPVPPPAYGGTEAVLTLLVEELVHRGHDVTLCASGDSRTTARLESVYGRSLRADPAIHDPAPYEWVHVAAALARSDQYDIIHNHAGELAMAISRLVKTPMLTTIHSPITQDARFVWERYDGWYNTISHNQRLTMPDVAGGTFAGVVYNAIDVPSFPFRSDKDDYLLFLSRIGPEKGTHLAIQAAKRLGMRLIVAGNKDRLNQSYYDDVIRPLIDGRQISYAGEVGFAEKRELYANARCLLMPLQWEEPFGLVMAEAMACGTPVVAFRRGAAPEVVADKTTGYLVSDVGEMIKAVRTIDSIDPANCRKHVQERFSPAAMVDRYVAVYEEIVNR